MFFKQDDEFIAFCNNYLKRCIRNYKFRYWRNEQKKKRELILNALNDNKEENIELVVGENDINLDDVLSFEDSIENDDLYFAFSCLQPLEKVIVEYRLKGYTYKEINKKLNMKRLTTSGEIYNRALKKMRIILLEKRRQAKNEI